MRRGGSEFGLKFIRRKQRSRFRWKAALALTAGQYHFPLRPSKERIFLSSEQYRSRQLRIWRIMFDLLERAGVFITFYKQCSTHVVKGRRRSPPLKHHPVTTGFEPVLIGCRRGQVWTRG